ncbi:MAG: cytochrome b N-terminal domain-containing protein [Deltaproteobacteria bacterium]|nr:cytochrome b N-terminal domain-containing protein [Deltaproteobacteria bacterium]MBW1816127.1 cytochrome b N-terminal domain-containing protein [Deltaproteobacteria bacterium]
MHLPHAATFTDPGPRGLSGGISHAIPRLGLSCLVLCLLSGIVLSFYFRPMGDVFQNVEEITTLAPYGWFFRQFHYVSGQMFVILMFIHTMDHLLKRRYRMFTPGGWALLVLSLGLCFFTLFTGFILKGDKEGFFAGQIFNSLLLAVPGVGPKLSNLFIVPGESFFFLPYLYHCFFLPLLVVYLLRSHIRAWLPNRTYLLVSFLGLFIYACIVKLHPDIPPDAEVAVVKGPWFFLGIQTLLKTVDARLAGLVIPLAFLAILLALPLVKTSAGGAAPISAFLYFLVLSALVLYAALTLWAAFG